LDVVRRTAAYIIQRVEEPSVEIRANSRLLYG
jgi:hypothetical protein